MPRQFFTIGHSTRSIGDFIALLNAHNIKLIVDVRAVPRSRTNPQFNSRELAEALSKFQIGYQHIAALGGLRGKTRDLPQQANALWKNQSFHNYADYAMSDEFKSGLKVLRKLGRETTCAVMCAELVWWRCHRRIIADYLIASGETVFHILGPKLADRARLTARARIGLNVTVSYPDVDDETGKKLAQKR
jgi:uncharacterized protein (DUF488 family)